MKRLILLLPAAGLVWFLLPARLGIWNIGNQLGAGLCIFLLLWGIFYSALKKHSEQTGHQKAFRTGTRVLYGILTVGFLWIAVLTAQMVVAAKQTPPANTPAIVLGSQVRGDEPSLDLWARIGAATGYLKSNPEAVCIASGGQGEGENRTEAAVIREKLIERGISPDRILLEERSESTEENIRYSKELMEEHGLGNSAAIVTDEYHQLRAGWICKRQGLTPYAVSAESPRNIFSAMYARELLALTATLATG